MERSKYNRSDAVSYAAKWAFKRNSQYYDFDKLGGDCTNFISQCIYAGIKIMNYSKFGWFYKSINSRSSSWSGVEFLYDFLINNKGVGPQGINADVNEVLAGDIIQLSFDGVRFGHSLLALNRAYRIENIKVAAHTYDVFGKEIKEYDYKKYRCIHIV